MNKTDLADRLAARTGLSKGAARDAVDGVFAIVGEALADGVEVRLPGFGTFGTRRRPARTGRNPRTGEAVAISASTSPTFKAGKTLKDTASSRQNTRMYAAPTKSKTSSIQRMLSISTMMW